MVSLNIILTILYLSFGLLLLIFSYLTLKKKLPMNHLAGFRFPQSYHSEENWYMINSYGGKVLFPFAIILVIISSILPFVSFNGKPLVREGIYLLPILIIIFPTILSYNYARKLP